MSLRLRLSLLYTTLLGGSLLLFGSLTYILVSATLLGQVDQSLTQQAKTIISLLRLNEASRYDPRSLARFEPSSPDLMYQVWGSNRELQLSHPPGRWKALDDTGRLSRRPVFHTLDNNLTHMRVLSVPLSTSRGPAGTLQVAVSLSMLDTIQQSLSTILGLLLIFTMSLSWLIAWLVTRQALSPLVTATQVAAQIIHADDLSRRIPLTVSDDDEVGQLILSFNQTLSRLESLFMTQRRFVADVSHELRTPLTVIKGELALMRKMGQVDEDALDNAEGEVNRLTRMVGDLLLLAQAESGRLPLDLKPVELDTVLLEVFQQMHVLAGDRLTLKIGEIDQVQVVGDRDRLKQVLLNLAGNATQYTPPGGQVTLSLSRSGETARLIISDTGPGIPAEDLPHIFERFYRGEKSRKRGPGASGFGLGLSIAYWIVKNHGGKIDVDSKEGQGTTFSVWIPLRPAAEKPV